MSNRRRFIVRHRPTRTSRSCANPTFRTKCGLYATNKVNQPLKIAITGATGNIGYSLIFRVASGQMTAGRPVILHLIDIEPMRKVLDAVAMELEDCAFATLADVVLTTDVNEGFRDVDVALLVGSRPRSQGMERKDLLRVNGEIFRTQGRALDENAARGVKVLVVGNPANTNALIAATNAPGLNPRQFTCMTRLDHNRGVSMLARHLGRVPADVRRMIIWGNHSSTQFPDPLHCEIDDQDAALDGQWIEKTFVPAVQRRGARVIEARGASSAASAASAAIDHVRDWMGATAPGDWTSMGVPADGSYGVAPGVMFSYPVTTAGGDWRIVSGLALDDFERDMIALTERELRAERDAILDLLG